MTPAAIVAIALGGALGLLVLCLGWVMLTGAAPKPLKRCLVRYCVRGLLKRKDNNLPWDENAVSKIDELLYMGRMPRKPEQLAALKTENRVSAMVTLNEVWEMPFYLAIAGIMGKPVARPGGAASSGGAPDDDDAAGGGGDGSGVSFCHLPTVDFNAPSLADIRKAVEWMKDHVDAGHCIYVHCNAGRGRSAVIVLCYLMATRGFSAQEAYEHVRARRKIANLPALCGTRPQWRAVRKYEKELRKRREAEAGPPSPSLTASQERAAGVGFRSNRVAPEP